jgi:hypothetical protein
MRATNVLKGVLVSIGLVAGATSLFAQATTTDKLLYPAVYQIVTEGKAKLSSLFSVNNYQVAYFKSIDAYNNEVVLANMFTVEGASQQVFDLKISLQGDQVVFALSNIHLKQSSGAWTSNDSQWPIHPNETALEKAIAARVKEIFADTGVYQAARSAALGDLYALNAMVSNLNDIQLENFVKDQLADQHPSFVMDASVIENNKNSKYADFKYHVFASVPLPKANWQSLTEHVWVSYYTNREEVTKVSKGGKVQITGKVVGLEPKVVGNRIDIIMTD